MTGDTLVIGVFTGETLLKASNIKCYVTWNEGLLSRGVDRVIDCVFIESFEVAGVDGLTRMVSEVVGIVFTKLGESGVSFESNEPIGSTHMIYRYHVNLPSSGYIGVRAVLRGKNLVRLLFTVPRNSGIVLSFTPLKYNAEEELAIAEELKGRGSAPGQVYIENPVIYNVMGLPSAKVSTWTLKVEGEVEKPVSLGLVDLYEIGVEEVVVDFHCVTGWSIKKLVFGGVKLKKVLEKSKFKPSAKWLYVESLDGYSTILPLKEALSDNALIALEMNRKPLSLLHGYPARLLIPQLYGWKSAKWVSRILLLGDYRDGYWEALGYHPRGRVDLEERFKRF